MGFPAGRGAGGVEPPVGGVTLSDRLYRNARQASALARKVIEDHLKGPHRARELAKALYEGYD